MQRENDLLTIVFSPRSLVSCIHLGFIDVQRASIDLDTKRNEGVLSKTSDKNECARMITTSSFVKKKTAFQQLAYVFLRV